MDSINNNQQEINHDDLTGQEAVKKLKDLVEKARSCFFCTELAGGPSDGVRPMSVLQTDDEGNLWFLSATDSHKNEEITNDSSVRLYFQGSAHSDFLYLTGNATVSKNAAKIRELWEPTLKTWFTEGKDDSRISVIKVEPQEGYYWDTKHGNAVAAIKIMIGAALGKTMDDSIEGKLEI